MNERLDRLFERTAAGVKLSLDTVGNVLAELGSPHLTVPAVHVAGTNGKGSVCAMVEALLRGAGLRTGLFVSPHLVHFRERFRVDGEEIGDAALEALLDRVEKADQAQVNRGENARAATFFEMAAAMAFQHFADHQVDIAILETGMGGRLDATNWARPVVTGITPVELDHMAILGADRATIAGEKAGIIKTGRPVVVADMAEEAREVIFQTARARQSPVVDIRDYKVREKRSGVRGQVFSIETPFGALWDVQLPLIGAYQAQNAGMAVALTEAVEAYSAIDLDWEQGIANLKELDWPGRTQWLAEHPPILMDGAHNPHGATALAKTVKRVWPSSKPVAIVCGFCRDKEVAEILRPFRGRVDRVWATDFDHTRALDAREVANRIPDLEGAECSPVSPPEIALEEATHWARENGGGVLVMGSLFLIARLLAQNPVTETSS